MGADEIDVVFTEDGNYMKFYQNVYDVLIDGKEMDVKPVETRNIIRLIELAFESNVTGKGLDVDF